MTYPQMVHKKDLPTKVCPVCSRPFSWRKKWRQNWKEVKYCSKRCRKIKSSRIV